MNVGLHFEPAWQEGHLVYVYTGVGFSKTHALAIPLFPAYLEISAQRLAVCLIDTRNPVHSTLIEIPISESYAAFSEQVTAELQRLAAKPFKLPASCSDGPLRDLCRNAGLYWLEKSANTQMLLAEILIDFLLDLHTSEVFSNCPHLAALRRTIQSNPLFRAIEARAILAYTRWQARLHPDRMDLQQNLAEARTRLISALLRPDSVSVGGSGWFDQNLEMEIRKAQELPDDRVPVLPETLLPATSDWLLARFNYTAAYKLIWPQWQQTRWLHAVLISGLFLSALAFLIGAGWGICTGIGAFVVYTAVASWQQRTWRHFPKVPTDAVVSLLSPRLLIALAGSWLGYTFSVKSYFNTEVFLLLFYPAAVPLMYLYANREIRKQAPDLPQRNRNVRSWGLLGSVYGLTLLLGMLILSPMVTFTTSSADLEAFYKQSLVENTFVLELPLFVDTYRRLSRTEQCQALDRLAAHLKAYPAPEHQIARRQLHALGIRAGYRNFPDADSLARSLPEDEGSAVPPPPLAQLSQVRYPYLGWRVVYRIGNYHFFPIVLLSYGGIVFFITLFLNFLLKGEPLSGWPGRRGA